MAVATVTILFTDLVSSTEMLSRLGEEAAEILRREHFRLLREAIAANGGHEVKNLGDGLMVNFDAVSSAIACAVSMQQVLDARNRSAEEALLLRMGLSSGEAEMEEGDFFGIPVVEAARLCAKAEGGQILTTELVRLLAGGRGGFNFESVGQLELKGLDTPVAGYRITWEPLAPESTGAVALPHRVEGGVTTFVGRAVERQKLQGAFAEVSAGRFRVVLVAGEAGIGKTCLASSVAKEVFESGAMVLYGRCEEHHGVQYQPWVEALGHLVRYVPSDMLSAHVALHRGALARYIPELSVRTGIEASDAPAGSAEGLPFPAVADLLARASELAPVVIVMDDLHWADEGTAQLLRHIGTTDAEVRALVVGTFRDSKVDTGHPLASTLAAFHRIGGVERMVLRGLGPDELEVLIESVAGQPLDQESGELRDALLHETDGHPFFVQELLQHLVEEGALQHDGRWVGGRSIYSVGLPLSIREVIQERVARLGEKAPTVLSMAAVIGRDFDVELLARVVDVDEATLIDALDNAVADGVLLERDLPGQFRFTHALFEHALYLELSAFRRASAHREVATALEEMCGEDPGERIGELTYQWALAAPRLRLPKHLADRKAAQTAAEEALEEQPQLALS